MKATTKHPAVSAGKLWVIYALVSPLTPLIVYIGITTRPLRERLQEHLAPGAHQGAFADWLSRLSKAKVEPLIVPLGQCFNHRHAQQRERDFVILALECSMKVLNSKHVPLAREAYAEWLINRLTVNERFRRRFIFCLTLLHGVFAGCPNARGADNYAPIRAERCTETTG